MNTLPLGCIQISELEPQIGPMDQLLPSSDMQGGNLHWKKSDRD